MNEQEVVPVEREREIREAVLDEVFDNLAGQGWDVGMTDHPTKGVNLDICDPNDTEAVPVEPEWEYRRVPENGQLAICRTFESVPELDEGWIAERRSVGPWLPVEPVQVDAQPRETETGETS